MSVTTKNLYTFLKLYFEVPVIGQHISKKLVNFVYKNNFILQKLETICEWMTWLNAFSFNVFNVKRLALFHLDMPTYVLGTKYLARDYKCPHIPDEFWLREFPSFSDLSSDRWTTQQFHTCCIY